MRWKIDEYEGSKLLGTYLAPGNLTASEVKRILCQMYARHLQPHEVISSNLRRGMRGKTEILEIFDNKGVISIGENPHLTARKVESEQ